MWLFGLPIILAASIVFCELARAAVRTPPLRRLFRCMAIAVTSMFGLELVLLVLLGGGGVMQALGTVFSVMHVVVTFLLPPSVASLVIRRDRAKERLLAFLICLLACIVSLIFNLAVMDATGNLAGR